MLLWILKDPDPILSVDGTITCMDKHLSIWLSQLFQEESGCHWHKGHKASLRWLWKNLIFSLEESWSCHNQFIWHKRLGCLSSLHIQHFEVIRWSFHLKYEICCIYCIPSRTSSERRMMYCQCLAGTVERHDLAVMVSHHRDSIFRSISDDLRNG